MKLSKFVTIHKDELDEYIRIRTKVNLPVSKDERKDWVLNDESLYNWAKSEGVKI